jgi:nucleotide-binding universal stress UspA family protein
VRWRGEFRGRAKLWASDSPKNSQAASGRQHRLALAEYLLYRDATRHDIQSPYVSDWRASNGHAGTDYPRLGAVMNVRPSILCPVDFSDASAGALRYAAAIAAHFPARLIVLTVEDPLLTEEVDLGMGIVWSPEESIRELQRFAAKTFGSKSAVAAAFEYEVAVGKPAAEILRVSRERSCDLIVLSTHGITGMRKLFFGSTTERVLREATKPVLVTPLSDAGPVHFEDAKSVIRRMLIPIDLSAAALQQTQIACRVADAVNVPVILVHVKSRWAARLHLPSLEADRRAVAEGRLNELLAAIPGRLHAEALVAFGDPAEEIAKIARDRHVGLIVMGLHGSPMLGPRMGSVTYRLLCMSPTLVLAVPPTHVDIAEPAPVAQATASDVGR